MPKGEFDTPGPFTGSLMDSAGIYRALGPHTVRAARFDDHIDQAERDELVDLLNKGTHFDGMLAALKLAKESSIAGAVCIRLYGGAPANSWVSESQWKPHRQGRGERRCMMHGSLASW